MRRGVGVCLVAVLLLAQAGVLIVHSGDGFFRGTISSGSAIDEIIIAVNDLFTFTSIRTRGIADLRDAVLPLAAGAALILLAVQLFTSSGGEPAGADSVTRGDKSGSDARPAVAGEPATGHAGGWIENPVERWFVMTAGAVALIAVISTLRAGTHDYSWGWIVRFLCGAALAWTVGRLLPQSAIKTALGGTMIVAIVSLLLAVAYRHSRGQLYFSWPIGALTPLAVLAGMWTAMGLAGGVALLRGAARDWRLATVMLAAAALAGYVTAAAQRRAALVGLVVAVGFFVWGRLRTRLDRRMARLVGVGVVGMALLAAVGYGAYQLRRDDRTAAGSVSVRLEYWRLGLEMLGDAASLGTGPDTTTARLTNAVAPLRDVSPHVYHGHYDPTFHNEWLQAMVELGIPGGLFYALLPAGTLILARRRAVEVAVARIKPDGDGELLRRIAPPAAIEAAGAGLVALCVADAASITLRGPMAPLFYWSLVGLLLAGSRGDMVEAVARGSDRAASHLRQRRRGAVVAGLAAFACLTAGIVDIYAATSPLDQPTGPRLYAENTILGAIATGTELARQGRWEETAAELEPLYETVPGFHDVPARYAEALYQLGRRDDAEDVLRRVLSEEFRPHEPNANVLLARHFASDADERLTCVQRALRHETALDAAGWMAADAALLGAAETWVGEPLADARQRASSASSLGAEDDAPELLRLAAFVRAQAGRFEDAADAQRIAAGAYEQLERENHRFRRGGRAEYDAFYWLARLLYRADRRNHAAAFEAIRKAERYAVMTLRHERVWPPRPAEGFLFGEVMPVEYPDELRPLWSFSAKMHLIAGVEENIKMRIYFSLPPDRWLNEQALRVEMGRLASECVEELSALPPDQRPASFGRLSQLARSLGATRG